MESRVSFVTLRASARLNIRAENKDIRKTEVFNARWRWMGIGARSGVQQEDYEPDKTP